RNAPQIRVARLVIESVRALDRAPEPGLLESQKVGMPGTSEQNQLRAEWPDARQLLESGQRLRIRQRLEVGGVQITGECCEGNRAQAGDLLAEQARDLLQANQHLRPRKRAHRLTVDAHQLAVRFQQTRL